MEYQVSGLRKAYGKRQILRDIEFGAKDGMCIGILGGNGSGKSTLLAILAGIVRADAGMLSLDGTKVPFGRGIAVGYVPQGNPLAEELTVRDHLRLWYDKESLTRELESGVLKDLGLDAVQKMPVRKLSGGMKKRLVIGCAAADRPKLLLMDEPTSSLDLAAKEAIYEYMHGFLGGGGIILLATHDVHEIESCDLCYILRDGKNIPCSYEGDLKKLTEWMR